MLAELYFPMPLIFLIIWSLLSYFLLRLQFFIWNRSYFSEVPLTEISLAFLHGLRFDFFAVGLLNLIPGIFLVFILAKTESNSKLRQQLLWRGLFPLLFLLHWPFLLFNLNDSEFIHFLGRRYTFDSLFLLKEADGKIFQLINSYWKLNILNLTIEIFIFYVLWKWVLNKVWQSPRLKLSAAIGWSLAFFFVSVVSVRGGLQNKPISFAHAQVFQMPLMNSLTMNSTFTLAQTIKRQSLDKQKFMSESEMLQILRPEPYESLQSPKNLPLRTGGGQKPNVVFIILESFSYEFLGAGQRSIQVAAEAGRSYTPFLDELAKKSLFFENHFANARRSIEGIGAIIGGIPSLMSEPFLSSQYLTNHFVGAGTHFAGAGYHTSFFHGAKNGSMYFDQFMKSAGIQNYFGKNEFPDPSQDDGTWGIWDEPFFEFFKQKISTFPEPFLSCIFSLSSHHPYRIPKEYEGQFPIGESEIHPSIGYTDMALKKFFASAEKEKWYMNTIFIITADHTYKPVAKAYQNELGNYRTPWLIYAPGLKLPQVDTRKVTQQIDILPSVLDLVGIQRKEEHLLAQSVFSEGPRWAINYSDGNYLFVYDFNQMPRNERYWFMVNKMELMGLSGASSNGELETKPRIFALHDMQAEQALDLSQPENQELSQKMGKKLQAMVQYFSQAMWDNKIYYPSGR